MSRVRTAPPGFVAGDAGRHRGASIGIRGLTGFFFGVAMRFAFMCFVCLLSGCGIPAPASPPHVTPAALASAFRDTPAVANTAYRGIVIRVSIEHCRPSDDGLTWSLGTSDESKPVVQLHFAAGEVVPKPAPRTWVIGRCDGRVVDGLKRELAGFDFYVLVVDCRIAP